MKQKTTLIRVIGITAAMLLAFILAGCAQQPQSPMEMRTVSLCDLNADGQCDAADLALFQQALGKHQGDPGYRLSADVDADGVVTTMDQQVLFPNSVISPVDNKQQQPQPTTNAETTQQPRAEPDLYNDNLNESIDELNQLE